MEKVKSLLKNKKFLLSLFVLVIIVIGIIIALTSFKDDSSNVNNLPKQDINISKVKDGYEITKDITVSNDGSKTLIYDLVWVNVTNNFKTQSDLLYSISGSGDGAVEVGTSQVPVVESPIMKDIKLEKGKVHNYKLKIWYDKSKKSKDNDASNFKGYVTVKKHE